MLKPPSGSWRSRIERTALSISGRVGGFQTPFARRMEPELEQDVVGFERGVGGQFARTSGRRRLQARQVDPAARPRAPVAAAAIPARLPTCSGCAHRMRNRSAPGAARTARLPPPSRFLPSRETRARRRNAISSCTRCSGAEAPAVTADVLRRLPATPGRLRRSRSPGTRARRSSRPLPPAAWNWSCSASPPPAAGRRTRETALTAICRFSVA